MNKLIHPTTMTLDQARRVGRWVGVLFLVTFATSIPALLLYGPVLHDAKYVLGSGADAQIYVAVILELLLVIANIATAVVLYPLARLRFEGAALGFLAARVMECVFIAVGILCVLTVVTLRSHNTHSESLEVIALAFVAVKDWTFLLGPGFVVGIGNGLLLGWIMYRSGMVPARLAMFGLVGGPLLLAAGIAVMFGVFDQGGVWQAIATIPEFIWELVLGLYLTASGGRPAGLLFDIEAGAKIGISETPA